MRLFEIPDALEHILAAGLDTETGEITDEAMAAIEELEGERGAKCLALAAYMKGELAEAAAVKAEAQKLKQRAVVHMKRANRLHDYLSDNLPQDAPKLSDARSVIAWRKNPPRVELDDDFAGSGSNLDGESLCRHVPESWVPDKKVIGASLKAGEVIDGAKLVYSMRLEVK